MSTIETIRIDGVTVIVSEQSEQLQKYVKLIQQIDNHIAELQDQITIHQASKLELGRMIAKEFKDSTPPDGPSNSSY